MIQPTQRKNGIRPHHAAGVVAFVALVVIAFVVLSGVVSVVFKVVELAIVVGVIYMLARFFLRRSRA
jgi:hypothetical protein